MNKKKIAGIGVVTVVVVAIAMGALFFLQSKNNDEKKSVGTDQLRPKIIPCDLFTLDDAKKLIGQNVTPSPKNSEEQSKKDIGSIGKLSEAPKIDVKVTNCTYERGLKTVKDDSKSENNSSTTKPVAEIKNDTKVDASSNVNTPPSLSPGSTSSVPPAPKDSSELPVVITVRNSTIEQADKDYKALLLGTYQKTESLGDEAIWKTGKDRAGVGFGQLIVRSKENVIIISAGDNDLELAKKIINTVMDRLK